MVHTCNTHNWSMYGVLCACLWCFLYNHMHIHTYMYDLHTRFVYLYIHMPCVKWCANSSVHDANLSKWANAIFMQRKKCKPNVVSVHIKYTYYCLLLILIHLYPVSVLGSIVRFMYVELCDTHPYRIIHYIPLETKTVIRHRVLKNYTEVILNLLL